MEKELPIGFFDSGVGGLSVLKKAIEIMPNENYIYFGDSINAPYGTKSEKEVIDLTCKNVEYLMSLGVKAIVLACNTATSVAATMLRDKYPGFIIIGIEPAIKPAVTLCPDGSKVLVMATPVTLSKGKFIKKIDGYDTDKIIKLPCPGLAELVEQGHIEDEIIDSYIEKILEPYYKEDISTVVLGCTHYPFIKNIIRKYLKPDVNIIDGSEGTVKNLKNKLKAKGLLNSKNDTCVNIINSLDNSNIGALSMKLLEMKI